MKDGTSDVACQPMMLSAALVASQCGVMLCNSEQAAIFREPRGLFAQMIGALYC